MGALLEVRRDCGGLARGEEGLWRLAGMTDERLRSQGYNRQSFALALTTLLRAPFSPSLFSFFSSSSFISHSCFYHFSLSVIILYRFISVLPHFFSLVQPQSNTFLYKHRKMRLSYVSKEQSASSDW